MIMTRIAIWVWGRTGHTAQCSIHACRLVAKDNLVIELGIQSAVLFNGPARACALIAIMVGSYDQCAHFDTQAEANIQLSPDE